MQLIFCSVDITMQDQMIIYDNEKGQRAKASLFQEDDNSDDFRKIPNGVNGKP